MTIDKTLAQPTEKTIRELFGEKIAPDEKILWEGGGFYSHGSETKPRVITSFILTGLFAFAVLVCLLVQALLGNSVIALLLVLLVVLSFDIVIFDNYFGTFYPRYYFISDRQVGTCRRTLFGKTKCRCKTYDKVTHVEYETGGMETFVSTWLQDGPDDMTLFFSGLELTENQRAGEILSNAFESYKNSR